MHKGVTPKPLSLLVIEEKVAKQELLVSQLATEISQAHTSSSLATHPPRRPYQRPRSLPKWQMDKNDSFSQPGVKKEDQRLEEERKREREQHKKARPGKRVDEQKETRKERGGERGDKRGEERGELKNVAQNDPMLPSHSEPPPSVPNEDLEYVMRLVRNIVGGV